MSSETVVVELTEDERAALHCEEGGPGFSTAVRDQKRAILVKLRAALASDSQGGEEEEGVCPECDHDVRPGSSHARSCSRHPINQPHSHNQPEQGGEAGDWPELVSEAEAALDDYDSHHDYEAPIESLRRIIQKLSDHVPANSTPTQQPLSAEKLERLAAIASWIESQVAVGAAHPFVAFIRNLTSAPPEVSGEGVSLAILTQEECAALCYAAAERPRKKDAPALDRAVTKLLGPAVGKPPAASPPEPPVPGETGKRFLIAIHHGDRDDQGSDAMLIPTSQQPPAGWEAVEVMPVAEHEAALEEAAKEFELRANDRTAILGYEAGRRNAYQDAARILRGKQAAPPEQEEGEKRWDMNCTCGRSGQCRACEQFEAQRGSGPDGAGLIAAERRRQVEAEGWTPEHDDQHDGGELAQAAAAYALVAGAGMTKQADEAERLWPFVDGWKPSEDEIRNLAKAGALIAAEIDRLQRAQPPASTEGDR